ncbi:MAG: dihydroorotate dehydrogenase electron transfer subunit [Bacillota bacterium]
MARILSNESVGPDFYYMEIEAPEVAKEAVPGQFIHIKVNEGLDPLLRRPMSLHEIDREKGLIGILYQVRGKGTKILSKRKPDTEIDIMGPLGKGFTIDFPGGHGVIVGGGIGIAPLYPLVKELKKLGKEVTVILGARFAKILLREENFISLGYPVLITTDDGSRGKKGTVAELLAEFVQKHKVDFIYACGREPMLKQVEDICQNSKIKGEISLEAYMGCGVGACLSCSCERKNLTDLTGKRYAKVCTDGPVFPLGEVKLHDN